ncbi:MAG: hypothetical protein ACOVRP_07055, partial [Gemmatimonas sp.]
MPYRAAVSTAALMLTALAIGASRVQAQPAPAVAPPSRTIAFTTTEGTWVSLDVSPDGRTLVFELLGELYTLPVAGGRAQPLL